MRKFLFVIAILLSFLAGLALGGYLFSSTVRRNFVEIEACQQNCFKSSELLGFLASAGIKVVGDKLPKVIYETDKTLVFDIQYPYPPDKIHYVVVPKKDIKDVAQLTAEEKDYLTDAYLVIGQIVRQNNYEKYMVITNGAGYQEVAYLHFHVVVDKD